MISKVFGWVALIINLWMVIYALSFFVQYGMFFLVYTVGMTYINIRFIEKLGK